MTPDYCFILLGSALLFQVKKKDLKFRGNFLLTQKKTGPITKWGDLAHAKHSVAKQQTLAWT